MAECALFLLQKVPLQYLQTADSRIFSLGERHRIAEKILMPMALTDWQCILMTLFYRKNNAGKDSQNEPE